MKRLTFLTLFAALTLAAPPAFAGETVHVRVLGLVCEFCAKSIEKVFMKTEQVESVAIDLDKALVTLVMKEGQSFTDETITGHIDYAGYKVENIERASAPVPDLE